MSGKAIILCAPSGSGKTTLAKFLLSNEKLNLKFSVSATTRKMRSNEQDGVDYNFLEINNFKNKINNGEFIEHEEVYHNVFYGTLKSDVKNLLQNHNLIFDVDVVGAISLKKYFSDKALTIFINPPSLQVLEDRLTQRSLNSDDDLKERLEKAKKEIEMKSTFDYSITNDDLEKAKSDIFKKVDDFLNN
tara:strand:- start:40 stop:606 length:567 start_codon:yes stop_codon:yes gene_type:complete